MRRKLLTPTTIIPPELYVERAADRQLHSIVEDMGRPGYVLVARQMGKTNLLINMKRRRPQDVVLYLDLSTRFDSARAWFRHVVDSLLEAYAEEFLSCLEDIRNQRNSFKLEPNVEFDRHLRYLLRSTTRRVVVVLDEIDSLVNTSYSDTILAQIRSMYFSRVNHPEYSRLTYVLSGVAEPVDLIKDKNISPFNIGEKIYLDDFSRLEFETFLSRAELSLQQQTVDSIFDWVRGNPRMTWDLCSLVEDRLSEGSAVSTKDVDDLVERLYLTSFDRAPIDHIRSLVESDAQIRNAIVSIRYGKGAFLDDKTRSRLYLAGIVSAISSREIAIKNRVVDAALSENWLSQIEGVRKAMLLGASQSFDDKKYEEAILQFEEVLASNSEDLKPHHRIQLAISRYYVGQSGKAIHELRECESQATDSGVLQTIRFYIGAAHIAEKAYAEALHYLRLVEDGPDEGLRIQAQLSTVATHLHSGGKDSVMVALRLSQEIVSQLDGSSADPAFLAQALYNEARIHIILSNLASARACLARAHSIARETLEPAILAAQYELCEDGAERKTLAERAASRVLDSRLTIVELGVQTLELTRDKLAKILSRLRLHGLDSLYAALLEYAVQRIYANRETPFVVLLDLFGSLTLEDERRAAIGLVEHARADHLNDSVSQTQHRDALRSLALYARESREQNWIEKYVNSLDVEVTSDGLTEVDIYAIVHLTLRSNREGDRSNLQRLFNTHTRFADQIASTVPLMHLGMLYQRLLHLENFGPREEAREVALQLLAILEKDKDGKLVRDVPAMVPEIRRRAHSVLRPLTGSKDPFRRFGRNHVVTVQYGSSAPLKKKFKFVERDLRSGDCKLISD